VAADAWYYLAAEAVRISIGPRSKPLHISSEEKQPPEVATNMPHRTVL